MSKKSDNPQMKKRENFLFIIGIDTYDYPIFPNLSNAVKDAEKIRSILMEKYDFQLVEPPIYDESATRENIIERMNLLASLITKEDNLVIYFAGHGEMNSQTHRGYWVPKDADNKTSDFIPHSTIKDILLGIEAKHIFLISDACFSGSFLTQNRSRSDDLFYKKIDESKSRWFLASGRKEKVSDGIPGQGSPFANALSKILNENENKYLSVNEIITYVTKTTGNISSQQPIGESIQMNDHENGQMVFILNGKYVKEEIETTSGIPNTKSLEREIIEYQNGFNSISVGKDILLIKSFVERAEYQVVELFRFNDDGKKKNFYKDGKLLIETEKGEVISWEVIRRFSTWQGLERFMEKNPKYMKGGTRFLRADRSIDEVEKSDAAINYRERLKKVIKDKKSFRKCLHCEKPITTNDSLTVEIDEFGLQENLGSVHQECLRPLDRIVGISYYAKPDEGALINFDYEKWLTLLQKGQGFIGPVKNRIRQNISHITWNPENLTNEGNYCIRINLKDGSYTYAFNGGKLERFMDEEIDYYLSLFSENLQKGISNNDPICYSQSRKTSGNYSILLQIDDDEPIEVESYEKIRYSAQIVHNLSSVEIDNDYTPLCLVIEPQTEKIIFLDSIIPIISNPLDFNKLHKNWVNAGIDLGKCELKIVESDLELNHYILKAFASGFTPILDPIFDKNFSLVKGIIFIDINEIKNQPSNSPTPLAPPLREIEDPKWFKGDHVALEFPNSNQKGYPKGILLEDEMVNENGDRCVIFRPIENGKELDQMYIMPSNVLRRFEDLPDHK